MTVASTFGRSVLEEVATMNPRAQSSTPNGHAGWAFSFRARVPAIKQLICAALTGCSAPPPSHYAQAHPQGSRRRWAVNWRELHKALDRDQATDVLVKSMGGTHLSTCRHIAHGLSVDAVGLNEYFGHLMRV